MLRVFKKKIKNQSTEKIKAGDVEHFNKLFLVVIKGGYHHSSIKKKKEEGLQHCFKLNASFSSSRVQVVKDTHSVHFQRVVSLN
jgi:hypothetical protein